MDAKFQVKKIGHSSYLRDLPDFLQDANLLGYYMKTAIGQAEIAYKACEVPVGAILVDKNGLVIKNYNRIKELINPAAHAEMLCIQEASRLKQTERPGGVLFVTLEPCVMCVGAIVLARLDAVIFSAFDTKTGACGSAINLFSGRYFNHKPQIFGGLLAEESGTILKSFFKEKRIINKHQ